MYLQSTLFICYFYDQLSIQCGNYFSKHSYDYYNHKELKWLLVENLHPRNILSTKY